MPDPGEELRKQFDEGWIKKSEESNNRPNGAVFSGLLPRTLFWNDIKNLPDPEWLIKGVLVRNSLVEVYGPFSCGKSFLVADIGLHIALGWDWLGHKVVAGGVLYVCIEGGSQIKQRQLAFQKHHNIDFDEIELRFGVVKDPTNIFDQSDVEQLIVDANAVTDLSLLILDTANRVMPGTKEDTEDMGKLINVSERLQMETGATVLIVHHTGKVESSGSRGGYNLPAAMDTLNNCNPR
jgi:RecA-family ATPase